MTPLRVLAVASEIYPIIKTGGLADVAGALPTALRAYDIETRTLIPGYPDVIKGTLPAAEVLLDWPRFSTAAPSTCSADHTSRPSICWCSMRLHLLRGPATPIFDAGRQGLARQRRALRSTFADRGRNRPGRHCLVRA